MRIWWIILSLVAIAPTFSSASVQLTYLGNEGFLMEAGSKSVLIDALYGQGLSGYPVLPDDIRRQVENAEGKFAEVDLVVSSHHHADHFDAAAVSNYLIKNTNAHFVSTAQAVNKLQTQKNWVQIKDRVRAELPAESRSTQLEIAGIRIFAFNLHHGKDLPRPVENIGWMVELGGRRLIHLGDTVISAAEITPLKLQELRIDIRLVPYWYLLDAEMKKTLDHLPAAHTILMHIPEPKAPQDYFGEQKTHQGLLELLKENTQQQDWIPVQSGETRVF